MNVHFKKYFGFLLTKCPMKMRSREYYFSICKVGSADCMKCFYYLMSLETKEGGHVFCRHPHLENVYVYGKRA